MVTGGETPREQRLRADSAKISLKAGFMGLPLFVRENEEEVTVGSGNRRNCGEFLD